eukprot:6033992-Pyramimonas_sp.AAC.1
MTITANSKELAKHAKAGIGPLGGSLEDAPPSLGIDYIAGKPKFQVRRLSKRAARWRKFKYRMHRLNKFRGSRRLKTRLYKASAQSVISYGAQVQGFSLRGVLSLRESGGCGYEGEALG